LYVRCYPERAARVVVRAYETNGDVWNAFAVLAGVVGVARARELITAEPKGADAVLAAMSQRPVK
jgi:hypothetical protein